MIELVGPTEGAADLSHCGTVLAQPLGLEIKVKSD